MGGVHWRRRNVVNLGLVRSSETMTAVKRPDKKRGGGMRLKLETARRVVGDPKLRDGGAVKSCTVRVAAFLSVRTDNYSDSVGGTTTN